MSGSFQSVETLLSTLGSFSDSRSVETSPSASQTRITTSLSTAVPQQLNVVEQLEARGNGEPPSYTSVDPDWSIPIEYVQDAGQSLPALTEELADAQKTQNKELLRREEQLETLQNELRMEEEKQNRLQRDINSASKSICLCQEETTKLTALCSQLEKDMSSLVTDNAKLSHQLELAEKEAAKDEVLFAQQRTKMVAHKEATKLVERSLPVQQNLESAQASIDSLKEKRASYINTDSLKILSGERQRELQEMLKETNKTRSRVIEENSKLRTEIQQLQQQRSQLQCSVDVGRKRKQAQLTRLHHQLQEAQGRRKQWTEEAKRMKRTITALRQSVEE